MPAPIRELTLDELDLLLVAHAQRQRAEPGRAITSVHLHHTWVPDHASWRGLRTLEAIRRDHMQTRGFSDIAQHLTIDPQGRLWSGRPFHRAPASSLSPPGQRPPFNGNASAGPFMIEMVGNFDVGHDVLSGPQLDAVVAVVARVLARNGLVAGAATIIPHCAMDPGGKTCAGSGLVVPTGPHADHGLRPVRWVIDVPALINVAQAALATPSWRSDTHRDRVLADPLIAPEITRGPVLEDHDARHDVPERKYQASDLAALEARLATHRAGGACEEATDEELSHHVINLAYGELSSEGDFVTDAIQLKQVFDALETFLAPKPADERRVVLYAHGGLVGETNAVAYARQHARWWKSNGVYPIFFVWESGFFEIFRQRYLGARGLSAVSDKLIEVLTGPLGRRAWAEMKRSCRLAFTPRLDDGEVGGGYRALQLLRDLLRRQRAEVHLVGHSAGSIFMAELLERWFGDATLFVGDEQHRIASLQYLAPAITRQHFVAQVLPLLGGRVPRFGIYTMDDERERDDDCARVYRKSLLYLVSRAFEDGDDHVPILGMQRYLGGRQADPAVVAALAALGHRARIDYSSDRNDESGITRARHHGDFDNDPCTLESVLRVIANFDAGRHDFVRYCDMVGCGPLCRPAGERDGARDRSQASQPCRACEGDTRAPVADDARAGRRRALVIGIDHYAGIPGVPGLTGCVADAREWSSALRQLGFETEVLLDGQATIMAMHMWLRAAIEGAGPGDVLAFCFSGHGTRDPGIGAPGEADGRNDYLVLSPSHGKYLYADDQLRDLLRALPPWASFYAFVDSCYSGTLLSVASAGTPRFVELPAAVFEVAAMRPSARAPRAANAGPALLFAACAEDERAHEIDGRGVFSRVATPALLAAARVGATCVAYADACASRVVGQRPQLSYYNPADTRRVVLSPVTVDAGAGLRLRG